MPGPTAAEIANARAAVARARAARVPDNEIDAYLRSELGVGLKEIMQYSSRDAFRDIASGLTLGHNDELYGLAAKLTGGDYTKARDEVRSNAAASKAANPKSSLAMELAAGAVPGMAALAIPFVGEAADAGWLANAGRAALQGGLMGGVAGEGHSEAEDAAGVAKDSAVGGLLGAGVGAGASLIGSGIGAGVRAAKDVMDPTRIPVRAGAPGATEDNLATIARQNELAPGTAVAAESNPMFAGYASDLGGDVSKAAQVAEQTKARIQSIDAGRKAIGAKYDALFPKKVPVSDELRELISDIDPKAAVPKDAQEITFGYINKVREGLKGPQRAKLDKYLYENGMPELRQIDSDYRFIVAQKKAAMKTLASVNTTAKNAIRREVAGENPVLGMEQAKHTLLHKALGPNLERRAGGVAESMYNPANAGDTMQRMLQMKALLNPQPTSLLTALKGGLFGSAEAQIPNGLSLFDR